MFGNSAGYTQVAASQERLSFMELIIHSAVKIHFVEKREVLLSLYSS
jgi:hypothetical protein